MKWLHNILKGISLTSALFVFQACYGTPQDPLHEYGEALLDFNVKAADTGDALEGIRILARTTPQDQDWFEVASTDARGHASAFLPYINNEPGPFVRFEDTTGVYSLKDTSFTDLRQREIAITLTKE